MVIKQCSSVMLCIVLSKWEHLQPTELYNQKKKKEIVPLVSKGGKQCWSEENHFIYKSCIIYNILCNFSLITGYVFFFFDKHYYTYLKYV